MEMKRHLDNRIVLLHLQVERARSWIIAMTRYQRIRNGYPAITKCLVRRSFLLDKVRLDLFIAVIDLDVSLPVLRKKGGLAQTRPIREHTALA